MHFLFIFIRLLMVLYYLLQRPLTRISKSCIIEAEEFDILCLQKSLLQNVLVGLHVNKGDYFGKEVTNRSFPYAAYRYFRGSEKVLKEWSSIFVLLWKQEILRYEKKTKFSITFITLYIDPIYNYVHKHKFTTKYLSSKMFSLSLRERCHYSNSLLELELLYSRVTWLHYYLHYYNFNRAHFNMLLSPFNHH